MAQNIVDFSTDPSGDQLLDDLLTDLVQNLLTTHSGTSLPSYAVRCLTWMDTTTSPVVWKYWDGAQNTTLGTINESTNKFIPAIGGAVTAEGKITLPASTTSDASLNAPHGVAPSSPTNGDLWTTTAGVYVRVNGVNRNLIDSFEFLGAFTATNSATLPITSAITSTYDNYMIVLDTVRPLTDNVSLNMQVSTDNGSTWVTTGSYSHARASTIDAGTTAGAGGTAATAIILAGGLGNSTGESISGLVTITGVNNTSFYTYVDGKFNGVNQVPNYFTGYGGGVYIATTTVNAVRLLMSSGNITGTVYVYGGRKNA